ncbi:MAG: ech hydrogenase subunit C [Halobacteriales archaeon]|jgi:ech hydrogenase subunit C
MSKLVDWARKQSPWVLHMNCGSCNGCDIEIVDAMMPRYDIERFGMKKQGSPRHADVLLCTGPVTRQMKPRLERIYEQMPEPKHVVAVGTCACSGGVFHDHYNTLGGVDQVVPVDMYIPGCSANPESIIDGITKLLEGEPEAAPVGQQEPPAATETEPPAEEPAAGGD